MTPARDLFRFEEFFPSLVLGPNAENLLETCCCRAVCARRLRDPPRLCRAAAMKPAVGRAGDLSSDDLASIDLASIASAGCPYSRQSWFWWGASQVRIPPDGFVARPLGLPLLARSGSALAIVCIPTPREVRGASASPAAPRSLPPYRRSCDSAKVRFARPPVRNPRAGLQACPPAPPSAGHAAIRRDS